LGIAAATAVAVPRRAAAEEAPPAGDVASVVSVRVNLVGALGRNSALVELLAEWLGTSGVEYELGRQKRLQVEHVKAPRGSGPPVRIWLVALNPRRVRLYFAAPDVHRYLVRDVSVPTGLDEVGRERVVQVVLSSALAFAEENADSPLSEVEQAILSTPDAESAGTRTHVMPEAVQPKPGAATDPDHQPAQFVPPSTAATSSLGFAVSYGVAGKGDAGTAQGPGVAVELGHGRDALTVAFRAYGQYRPLRRVRTDRLSLAIHEFVPAGSVMAELWPGGPTRWRGEFGLGTQLVHFEPSARSDEILVRAAGWDARPFLLLGAGPAWCTAGVCLRLMARIDLQLSRTRYAVLEYGQARSDVVVPWLQPGVVVEVGGSPIRF